VSYAEVGCRIRDWLTGSNHLRILPLRILLAAGIVLILFGLGSWAAQPVITGVSIPDMPMKISDIVTATIYVQSDSETVYTLNTSSIGGHILGSLSKQDSTSYTVVFTVAEGGTDYAAGADIPTSVTLADNELTGTWNTSIVQASDPIDANRPTDPVPSSTSHTVSAWDNDDTVDIEFSTDASDVGGSGVDGFEIEWNQSATWVSTQTKEEEETWSGATLTATSDGDWYFHIATVDNAGNWTTAQHIGPFQIDTVAPSVPTALSPADNTYTNDLTPTLSWGVCADTGGSGMRDNDTYRVVVTGTPSKSYYTANLSYTPTLAEGVFTWKVYARDNAGNNSVYTSEITLTIDRTQPDVTIDQSGAQVDPTNVSPVAFTAVFDEPIDVATFTNADVTIDGTATTGAVTVTEMAPNDGTTFTVSVIVTSDGTVIASIPAGGVEDWMDYANTASTSIDNTVTLDTGSPSVMTVATKRVQIADADAGVGAFFATIVFNETMDVGVVPALAFSPDVTDGETPTLSNPAGVWSTSVATNDTYTVTYDVLDQGVDIDSVTIDVTGGQDLAGNGQLDYTPTHAFDIDMLNPSATSVAVDTNPLYDGDLIQRVTVTFNEAMDTSTNPAIAFGAGTFTTNNDGAWSISDTVWTESFTLADNNQDNTAVTVDVAGAKDVAGNDQQPYTAADEFDIDTRNPIVSSLRISDSWIDDLDIGLTFTVTIDFSDDMDGGTDPTIIFTPAIDTTLTLSSNSWLDINTFEAIYNVADANRVELDIDISVTGAIDAVGNAQVAFNALDEFDIDTVNPAPGTVHPLLIAPIGSTGGGAFLDRCLDLEEGEEPPMIGLRPLAATYEVGEAVTGACSILNLARNVVWGSYVHVFIYAVDIEVRPEALSLLDHWVVRYDRDRDGYSYSWDTAEYSPGYYDVYLSFRDGSGHTCRIQLSEPVE